MKQQQNRHVFISYVRENQKEVDRLYQELETHGVKVWLDRNDIKPGVFWENAIRKAIQDGAFFIACFSKEYNEKAITYMNEELNLAIEVLRKRPREKSWFIPVILSGAIPDWEILPGKTLQSIQQVPLYQDWDAGIQRILSVIKPISHEIQNLLIALRSEVRDIRFKAAESLGEINDRTVTVPALMEVLKQIADIDNPATTHIERTEIGDLLAAFGDPRFGVGLQMDGLPDIVWCRVPEGEVTIDNKDGTFQVDSFDIGKYPVTWIQYRSYLKTKGDYILEEESGWHIQPLDNPLDNHPIENISCYDSVAFCRWLTQEFRKKGLLERGQEIRLPTECEWQLAATGGNPSKEYPWGSNWDNSRANTGESRLGRTTAVGMYPNGASPEGVLDLIGNVMEWCGSNQHEGTSGVLRGGSFHHWHLRCRSTDRWISSPDEHHYDIGFRLAKSL